MTVHFVTLASVMDAHPIVYSCICNFLHHVTVKMKFSLFLIVFIYVSPS